MMRKLMLILCIYFGAIGCKSTKRNSVKSKSVIESQTYVDPNDTLETNTLSIRKRKGNTTKTQKIIAYAKQFEGVRYQFGGATRDGMDCSGLVFECFRAHNIILPRISRDMAKNGEKIALNKVVDGDLLFFRTSNRRNDISHVGLVVSVGKGDIQFIHATSSSGVIISSINERYWTRTFAEARRIL